MQSYRTSLITNAYEKAGSPEDIYRFADILVEAMESLDDNNYPIIHFLFECVKYNDLAVMFLRRNNIENNPTNLKRMKAFLRKRAERGKKEVVDTIEILFKRG